MNQHFSETNRRNVVRHLLMTPLIVMSGCAGRPKRPEVSYSPQNPQPGDMISFDASNLDDHDSYHWDFDADGDFEKQGIATTYSFERPGEHTITLQVRDGCINCPIEDLDEGYTTEDIVFSIPVSGSSSSETSQSDVTIEDDSINVVIRTPDDSISIDETGIIQFSVINKIGNGILNIQLILEVPSNMTIRGSKSVQNGVGQYTSTYQIESGHGRGIRLNLSGTKSGTYNIDGSIIYYFDENKGEKFEKSFTLPIPVQNTE
jgi:PKD repeat protein